MSVSQYRTVQYGIERGPPIFGGVETGTPHGCSGLDQEIGAGHAGTRHNAGNVSRRDGRLSEVKFR